MCNESFFVTFVTTGGRSTLFSFLFSRFNMEELDMGLSLTNKKRLRGSTNHEIPCVYEFKIAQQPSFIAKPLKYVN